MKDLNNIIKLDAPLKEALLLIDKNPQLQTLLIQDYDNKIVGTLTDGDIRRGLIEGRSSSDPLKNFMNENFLFLKKGLYESDKLDAITRKKLQLIPVLDADHHLVRIIDFNHVKTILPIDAVIMAGGYGKRLMPLTENTPKPMLKVGEKPILEHNVNLLRSYGIQNLTLAVSYLKEQIIDYFQEGSKHDLEIQYVQETEPLGTVGAVKKINTLKNDYILVMNADLLTNINLEQMFNSLRDKDGDMIVATVDYEVRVPYGVVECEGNKITGLKEKPTYSYYSNAGIYIFKREHVSFIPENRAFNATDLLETLIDNGKNVLNYRITDYWLDIGKMNDFTKAQSDINNIKL